MVFHRKSATKGEAFLANSTLEESLHETLQSKNQTIAGYALLQDWFIVSARPKFGDDLCTQNAFQHSWGVRVYLKHGREHELSLRRSQSGVDLLNTYLLFQTI